MSAGGEAAGGAYGRGRLAQMLRAQAEFCARLGSPLYHGLMRQAAADAEAGGPVAAVLRGHEDDPGPSALALRLFAAVHRLVLDGRVPELARYYPSVGGQPDAAAAWPEFRNALVEHAEDVRRGLDQAPQTNEVGRTAALLGGLLHVAAGSDLPVRLLEIGASAGLNLRADHFRVETADGSSWGPASSPVLLKDAWTGATPPLNAPLRVVERGGCDLSPVDPTKEAGRLDLMSYVWPDDDRRLARLQGALAIARDVPVDVKRLGAGAYMRAVDLHPGTTTVIWHSVMWQYLDPSERAAVERRIDELGAAATADKRLAHLSMEPRRRRPDADFSFLVTLRGWPGGDERVLGEAAPHGVPVRWE